MRGMRVLRAGLIVAMAAGAVVGCKSKEKAEWGYEGDIGPAHWGELSPDYALASTGREQSPIDIANPTVGENPAITFNYADAPIDVVNNGHTVEQKMAAGSSITVNGKTYALNQFHFHSPSEHTINGQHAAMEMHLVHTASDGSVAVIGVMLTEGDAANANFAQVWANMPHKAGATKTSEVTINPISLLPVDKSYYRYQGSFTTPPCTEGVLWMVMQSPVQLSAAQISAFGQIIDGNNRPVQPLNGRTVTSSR